LEPLREFRNQEPAAGGPAGVYNVEQAEKTAEPAKTLLPVAAAAAAPASMATVATLEKPDLRHIVPGDLRDTGRLLDLYDQAIGQGLALPSEWGRLRFVAVAEHARVIGTKNPCGLFVRLVRDGLWHFATGNDEETASVRIRRHLHEELPQRRIEKTPREGLGRGLSDDARLVQAVREGAARARLKGDPFPLLKREKPEWTRERWDRALAELVQ
jgi:hypothetical protein